VSDIEWTDATWNPIVGCSRVSPGCEHCYAERFVHRELAPQHRGLTVLGKGEKGPRWTGEVRLVESRLGEPLRWRKPKRVFVNSLSDLFHDALTNEQIAAVFGVMAACPHLTLQVLTKRPARMREWFAWLDGFAPEGDEPNASASGRRGWERWECVRHAVRLGAVEAGEVLRHQRSGDSAAWPLPNVWLGVTAEDQQRADERIPLLLDTPAAVRFVSYEPALGPVDFKNIASARDEMMLPLAGLTWSVRFTEPPRVIRTHAKLDWVIVGGESGPGARPFDLAWARSAVAQCRAAGVPVFVKQLGANVERRRCRDCADNDGTCEHDGLSCDGLKHRKGADPSEWPADLRVREFPR